MDYKFKKIDFRIKPINESNRKWIKKFITQKWGSGKIVSLGKIHFPHKLAGFVVIKDKKYLGLITYSIKKNNCQIITLDSVLKRKGISKALVEKVKKIAKKLRCKRLWAITTNDNIDALHFWQKRGFCIKKIYPNALEYSRKLKPEIPLFGNYGIPIRDEIELELKIIER